MKTLYITIACIVSCSAMIMAQIKKEDFTESRMSGSFVTLIDNKPVKDNQIYEETVIATANGGTSTLLKIGNGNTAQRLAFDNNNIVNSPIKVYPNPANDFWMVETNLVDEGDKLVFTLYDFTGKEARKEENISSKGLTKISRGQLHSGIYYYTVYNHYKNVSSGRILIE